MKTPQKARPKSSKHFLIASKKLAKQGLKKIALTLNWLPLTGGDTTSEIYRIGLQTVKKRRKRNKRLKALIGKIGWILFEALAVFFVNYFLLKMVSSSL
ncbi:MAG TPA: hypothetical protein DIS90_11315 [Cytophagales bacterium]|nr:hypothetical protein [Cytophagales bacterium]HRJ28243.1 hypothetical protein [Cyclobacteriaceae bacterium]HRJ28254.1 hypothetical protein [Cyclobacteriaceae bacterium]HRJ82305.1 hypothetical protein [Cyclobacteriaceae bacterium]HRJ82316.1 hypothetical protein [Cyclobacteriaceae bacterium]